MSPIPKVTVLMPVYNGEKYLREAIESILGQSFVDFEFLIIEDGSTDRSAEIIGSYADPRIRVVENGKNFGLITTLNNGIELARGEFIARMDSDDVSLPLRLEKQARFMESRPEVGVCGTWFRIVGSTSDSVRPPVADNDIRWFLTINSAFAHPSVMLRRNVLMSHNLRYDPNFHHAEDYELWTRIGTYCGLANIPEVLLLYRFHGNQVSGKYNSEQIATADRVRMSQLNSFGIPFSDAEFKLHDDVVAKLQKNIECLCFTTGINYLKDAEKWLMKLLNANNSGKRQKSDYFERFLAGKWFLVCINSTGLGRQVWRLFWQSPLSRLSKTSLSLKIKFWIKCLLRWRAE